MTRLFDLIRAVLAAEPAVFINFVVAAAALAAVFGYTIDDGTMNGIKNGITAVLAFLAAVFGTRQSVFAPDTHSQDVALAYEAGYRDSLPD